MHAAALAEDPTLFEYDAHVESNDASRRAKLAAADAERVERKSRYVETLMAKQRERAREEAVVYERRLLKERQKEDHLYADKEKFVTASYRAKLEADAKWLAEDKARDDAEAAEDVTKRGDLSDFHRNLMTRNASAGADAGIGAGGRKAPEPKASEPAPRPRSRSPRARRRRRPKRRAGGYERRRRRRGRGIERTERAAEIRDRRPYRSGVVWRRARDRRLTRRWRRQRRRKRRRRKQPPRSGDTSSGNERRRRRVRRRIRRFRGSTRYTFSSRRRASSLRDEFSFSSSFSFSSRDVGDSFDSSNDDA